MGGGHFDNVPELVEVLVKDAPSVIKWLEDLGVNWDKAADGTMFELSGGGTSRRRLHSARDYTGLAEMRVLRDEIRSRKIEFLEFCPAIELLMDKGKVCGAVLLNLETEELIVVRAGAVVLASGGIGRLHLQGFPTTNHYGATADGLVLAYRAGAGLLFIDTMQYHPTGVIYPLQILGQLVTEKVRTLGAQLVNNQGSQFIHPLEPRDVVASAIIRECGERKSGLTTPHGELGIWLDSPMIDIIRGEGTCGAGTPGHGAAVPAVQHRYVKRADTGIPHAPLPERRHQDRYERATTVPGLFAAGNVPAASTGGTGSSAIRRWISSSSGEGPVGPRRNTLAGLPPARRDWTMSAGGGRK
jgi:succinate dehydrogenase / fumarate reductase flavoprotein subunit